GGGTVPVLTGGVVRDRLGARRGRRPDDRVGVGLSYRRGRARITARTPARNTGGARACSAGITDAPRGTDTLGAGPAPATRTIVSATRSTPTSRREGTSACGNPSVRTSPGFTAVTRTPRSRTSPSSASENATTACFVAE